MRQSRVAGRLTISMVADAGHCGLAGQPLLLELRIGPTTRISVTAIVYQTGGSNDLGATPWRSMCSDDGETMFVGIIASNIPAVARGSQLISINQTR